MRQVRLVTTVARRVSCRGKLGLEVVEVAVCGHSLVVGRDIHQAVVVVFLGVFVDKTTREHRRHFGGVDGLDLGEWPRSVLVTAKLREEQRHRVVTVGLDLLVVTGNGEGRTATPRVVVEAKHVHTGQLVVTTVEVVGRLESVLLHIGSRVTHWNVTQSGVSLESLNVTHHGLDVGGSRGSSVVVDHFVSSKETQGVVVLRHQLDRGQNLVQVHGVVRAVGTLVTSNQRLWHVDVQDQVDSGVVQLLHALVVVAGVVDGVDPDSVDSELFEVLDVTLAGFWVGQRVVQLGSSARLVVETTNVESLVGALHEKCISSHFDGLESSSHEWDQGEEESEKHGVCNQPEKNEGKANKANERCKRRNGSRKRMWLEKVPRLWSVVTLYLFTWQYVPARAGSIRRLGAGRAWKTPPVVGGGLRCQACVGQ